MFLSFVENILMLNWIVFDNCFYVFMLYYWGNINRNLIYNIELFVVFGFRLFLCIIFGLGVLLVNIYLGYLYVG